jgi:hypothetical protein
MGVGSSVLTCTLVSVKVTQTVRKLNFGEIHTQRNMVISKGFLYPL